LEIPFIPSEVVPLRFLALRSKASKNQRPCRSKIMITTADDT
jgi:hypothetical protein